MKFLVILAVVAAAVVARPEDDDSASKLEELDVDALVTNDRLLKAYAQCILDKGSCTPEAKSLKKLIPDVIETNCKKCTPKQRTVIRKMIVAYRDKLPEEWKEMVKTYDPENKHDEDLKKILAETD